MNSDLPSAPSQRSPERSPMLVLEDDEAIRETLGLLLEDEGYCVAVTSTTSEALAQLRAAVRGYVVIMDFLLPEGNADILLRAVEADASLQRHRYILMPASQISRFSEEQQRLIAAYCTEVVYKPFDIDALLAAVERATAQLRQVGNDL